MLSSLALRPGRRPLPDLEAQTIVEPPLPGALSHATAREHRRDISGQNRSVESRLRTALNINLVNQDSLPEDIAILFDLAGKMPLDLPEPVRKLCEIHSLGTVLFPCTTVCGFLVKHAALSELKVRLNLAKEAAVSPQLLGPVKYFILASLASNLSSISLVLAAAYGDPQTRHFIKILREIASLLIHAKVIGQLDDSQRQFARLKTIPVTVVDFKNEERRLLSLKEVLLQNQIAEKFLPAQGNMYKDLLEIAASAGTLLIAYLAMQHA